MTNTIHLRFLFFFLLLLSVLNSIEIPFSDNEIKTEKNLLSRFLRTSPADSAECFLSTKVWFWHNGKNLYFLWEAEIDESFEYGKYTPVDKWPDSDYLRLQIITDVKSYYAYMYYAFPLGNRYDAINKPDFDYDKNWNSTYTYQSEILNKTWKVLMTIPFKDLRFYGSSPHNWKIILTRNLRKYREYYTLPFVLTKYGRDYFRKAENITINQNIRKTKNFYFRPYTILNYDIMDKSTTYDLDNLGLDFSFSPSFSTKLKFSLNPDYSDVPMDNEMDIYNSRYLPTFEENRYFFIEDFNIFGVDKNTFYTRDIIQPHYAVKFSGNTEHSSFGFLSTLDKEITEKEVLEDSTIVNTLNNDNLYNIIAFRPSGKNYSIQMTLLSKMHNDYENGKIINDYHNEVFHLAPEWEISDNKTLWLNLNLSIKEEQNTETKKGYYGKIGFNVIHNDFFISLSTQRMSKDYQMDMGRIYEDDFYGWNLDVNYEKDINCAAVRELGSGVSLGEEIDNISNELLERLFSINFWIDYKFDLKLYLDFAYVKELYYSQFFDKYRTGINLTWDRINWFYPKFAWNIIETLIYTLNNTYLGYYLQYGISGDISKYLSYNLAVDHIIIEDVPEHPEVDDNYWISNFDFTISLSNNLSLTNGIRFNNYQWSEYKNYQWSEYRDHLGIFSNFRWEYKPGSNLYLGYKSSTDEINGEYTKDYELLYIKISYTF